LFLFSNYLQRAYHGLIVPIYLSAAHHARLCLDE